MVRIAAAGDVHASEATRERIEAAFLDVQRDADLILLAGDLTTLGETEQARVLADVVAGSEIPVAGVLGNHDLHSGHGGEVAAILRDAGLHMLDRAAEIFEIDGQEVGVVGTKGFVGGFGNQLANFGEPLFREAYAETTRDVDGFDRALASIEPCSVRIGLLHYAPTEQTLFGEPERLWLVLGAERLAGPIRAHRPDIVLHGHAHHGSFEGDIDGVPVYNVAVHVMGRAFWIFELDAEQHAPQPPLSVDET